MAAACGLLAACSHSGTDRSGTPVIRRGDSGITHSAGQTAELRPADLVSAVSSGNGGAAPVDVKFQVGQRPETGTPVVITLRLTANQPLEHLEARFRADDGLDLTQGADFDPTGHMDAGATVDHNLTLIPSREGVFTVVATVTTGLAAEAVSRSFAIPIVVGSAAPGSGNRDPVTRQP